MHLVGEWDHEKLARYLDAAMEAEGIRTDAELARLSGVHQTQISNWRRGRSRPSMALLDRVADALSVPPVNLHVLAGWISREAPDLGVVPPEFRELIDFYNDPERTDDDRRMLRMQARVAVEGVRALAMERVSAERPTGRRRSA